MKANYGSYVITTYKVAKPYDKEIKEKERERER